MRWLLPGNIGQEDNDVAESHFNLIGHSEKKIYA